MDLEDYAVLLKDAINRTETIVFSCRCQVRYSGRAESYLDTGDRVVMIKSDGALLIHQPTGNAPINETRDKPHFNNQLRQAQTQKQ